LPVENHNTHPYAQLFGESNKLRGDKKLNTMRLGQTVCTFHRETILYWLFAAMLPFFIKE